MSDLDDVRALRELLEGGYRATPGGDVRLDERTVSVRPPGYDERVMRGLVAGQQILGTDGNYLEAVRDLRDRPVEEATRAELATWFTYFLRGERFSDGLVAGGIRSGQVLAMVRRLEELEGGAATP